ncbi:hypothetical protein INT43_003300 [Umbelopsis isabellina]|uniref:Uncharacterized protein n=1 Tax=Mortierella isabellina TaxID=91625 RepID=A0A8H7PPT9_MORIS|nr:hypothetical protein INT43_003300 [Umbelopsis isabellina]
MSTPNSQTSSDYPMLSQRSLDNSRLGRHPLRNRYSNYPPYRILTHHITLSPGTNRLSSSPVGDNNPLEENPNPCIMDDSNEVSYSNLDRRQLATERFDNFTKEDFISHSAVLRNQKTDNIQDSDTEPVAWFQVKRDNQQCVDLAERSGRYVLLKLLRSEHTAENIDLQYVGLMGYYGPRSFAIGTLC